MKLATGVAYVAQWKKDRSAYEYLREAQADFKEFGNLPVPLKSRNAPTKLMKDLGYGKGYEKYPTAPSSPSGKGQGEGFTISDDYLPDELKNKKYFN